MNDMPDPRAITEPTNGGEEDIESALPYMVEVTIEGTTDMLFHRWNPEAVEAKSKAGKNSKAKKTDNIESYVYRDERGYLAVPGEYLRMSICYAAKFRQDPRSPRKSAFDLYKAGVTSLTMLAPILVDSKPTKVWSYEDKRRVLIQRQAVNRIRPAFRVGWKAKFELQVGLAEYISQAALRETVSMSGRFIGLADFRPTFGRFSIVSWKPVELT